MKLELRLDSFKHMLILVLPLSSFKLLQKVHEFEFLKDNPPKLFSDHKNPEAPHTDKHFRWHLKNQFQSTRIMLSEIIIC